MMKIEVKFEVPSELWCVEKSEYIFRIYKKSFVFSIRAEEILINCDGIYYKDDNGDEYSESLLYATEAEAQVECDTINRRWSNGQY